VLGGSAASTRKGDLYTLLHHTVMGTAALLVGLSPSMGSLGDQEGGHQGLLSSVATSTEVSSALRLSETTGEMSYYCMSDPSRGKIWIREGGVVVRR
jgi:hypothetical protein